MCFRFPIEQTTFGRYCVLLALQMLGGFVILACVAVTLSFFVSVCIYLIAIVRNYEVLLDDINAMASTEDINQIDCKVKFTQIVQYHNEIYELGQLHSCNFTSNAVNTHFAIFPPHTHRMAEDLISLMRPVIISTLYGSVIFFATSIFQCESMVRFMENLSFDAMHNLFVVFALFLVLAEFKSER